MKKRRNTDIPAVPARDVVSPLPIAGEQLLTDLRALIDSARQRVAQTVNAELVLMYWRRYPDSTGILAQERAAYGEQIVSTLSRQLTADYERLQSPKPVLHDPLRRSVARRGPRGPTGTTRGLEQFKEILYLEDALQRDFYAEMCRLERWSVRTLRDRVRSMREL
jgi:hypothetical protein